MSDEKRPYDTKCVKHNILVEWGWFFINDDGCYGRSCPTGDQECRPHWESITPQWEQIV